MPACDCHSYRFHHVGAGLKPALLAEHIEDALALVGQHDHVALSQAADNLAEGLVTQACFDDDFLDGPASALDEDERLARLAV